MQDVEKNQDSDENENPKSSTKRGVTQIRPTPAVWSISLTLFFGALGILFYLNPKSPDPDYRDSLTACTETTTALFVAGNLSEEQNKEFFKEITDQYIPGKFWNQPAILDDLSEKRGSENALNHFSKTEKVSKRKKFLDMMCLPKNKQEHKLNALLDDEEFASPSDQINLIRYSRILSASYYFKKLEAHSEEYILHSSEYIKLGRIAFELGKHQDAENFYSLASDGLSADAGGAFFDEKMTALFIDSGSLALKMNEMSIAKDHIKSAHNSLDQNKNKISRNSFVLKSKALIVESDILRTIGLNEEAREKANNSLSVLDEGIKLHNNHPSLSWQLANTYERLGVLNYQDSLRFLEKNNRQDCEIPENLKQNFLDSIRHQDSALEIRAKFEQQQNKNSENKLAIAKSNINFADSLVLLCAFGQADKYYREALETIKLLSKDAEVISGQHSGLKALIMNRLVTLPGKIELMGSTPSKSIEYYTSMSNESIKIRRAEHNKNNTNESTYGLVASLFAQADLLKTFGMQEEKYCSIAKESFDLLEGRINTNGANESFQRAKQSIINDFKDCSWTADEN